MPSFSRVEIKHPERFVYDETTDEYEELFQSSGLASGGYDLMGRIPQYIRWMIWKELMPESKVILLYDVKQGAKGGNFDTRNTDAIDACDADSEIDIDDIDEGNTHYKVPVILHICRESRAEGLKHLRLLPAPYRNPRPLYVNYAIDTIRIVWPHSTPDDRSEQNQLKLVKRFKSLAHRSRRTGLTSLAFDAECFNNKLIPNWHWEDLVNVALNIPTIRDIYIVSRLADDFDPPASELKKLQNDFCLYLRRMMRRRRWGGYPHVKLNFCGHGFEWEWETDDEEPGWTDDEDEDEDDDYDEDEDDDDDEERVVEEVEDGEEE